MFSRAHTITAFICFGIGLGFASQAVRADSTNLGQEFLSLFRSHKSQATKKEGTSSAPSSASYHRLARTYVEQNDTDRANTYFGLALQHAAPHQIVDIATEYATFLTEKGDLRRAEFMLRQALNQSPDDAELAKMLARCLVRQDKMVEGRRYFLSVCTDAEARAEIAAIYRQQGNTEMLVAVEEKWGPVRSNATRPAMVRPEAVQSAPLLVAAVPKSATAPMLSGTVRALPQPPFPATLTPRAVATTSEGTVIAAAPAAMPGTKSEFFDNRVPIPVPRVVSLPVVVAAHSPSPEPAFSPPSHVATRLQPMQSASTQPVPERFVLTNPVRLATAPIPVTSEIGTKESPRPTTTVQPRRHYVVNAGPSAELEAILPVIKPAAASVAR